VPKQSALGDGEQDEMTGGGSGKIGVG